MGTPRRSRAALRGATSTSPTDTRSPSNRYSVRSVPGSVRGSSKRAPGDNTIDQMATSDSGLDAHESGGGAGAARPACEPATIVTETGRPASSTRSSRGTWAFQNIEKNGLANLRLAGKFSQI